MKIPKASLLFVIRCISFFLFLGIVYALTQYADIRFETLKDFAENIKKEYGLIAPFFYIFLSAIGTFFFVPRQLLALVAGFIWGAVPALIVVSLGAGIGCCFSMLYGKFLAKHYFQHKMKSRILCLEYIFSKSAFWLAVGIRILPIGSNTLLNMITGATKIPFVGFWLGSMLGYVPQNCIFALLGSYGKTENDLTFFLTAILYVLLLLIGFYIVKKNVPMSVNLAYIYNGIVRGK